MREKSNSKKAGIAALALILGASVGADTNAEVILDPGPVVEPGSGGPVIISPGNFLKLEIKARVGEFLKIEEYQRPDVDGFRESIDGIIPPIQPIK